MESIKPTRQQRDIIGSLHQTIGSFQAAQPPYADTPTAANSVAPSRRKNSRALIVATSRIRTDPGQVRQKNREETSERIQELARSIQEVGLQQPPGVREAADGMYEVVYGEGRFIAMTQILGWPEVEVICVDVKDEDVIWHQLHENIHRTNLDPLDLAQAVATARAQGHSLGRIAERMGKSETWVQKAVTVGERLSEEARETLARSSERQAMDAVYAISQAPAAEQADIAREVVEKKLTRRETEELVGSAKTRRSMEDQPARSGRKKKSKAFETTLRAGNGASVTVRFRKAEVESTEVLAALEEVLHELRRQAGRPPAA